MWERERTLSRSGHLGERSSESQSPEALGCWLSCVTSGKLPPVLCFSFSTNKRMIMLIPGEEDLGSEWQA